MKRHSPEGNGFGGPLMLQVACQEVESIVGNRRDMLDQTNKKLKAMIGALIRGPSSDHQ
jgi:hypothetical protein